MAEAGIDCKLSCPFRKFHPAGDWPREAESSHLYRAMIAILRMLALFVGDLFKSRRRQLEAENLLLRHQLNIALRGTQPRLQLRNGDRVLLVLMTKLWPSLLGVVRVVQAETALRWHRAGFRMFWR